MEHENNDNVGKTLTKTPVLQQTSDQMSKRLESCFGLIRKIEDKVDLLIGSETQPDQKGSERESPNSFIRMYKMQNESVASIHSRLEHILVRLNDNI